jgi:predicted N-acetyltransferase YhbS
MGAFRVRALQKHEVDGFLVCFQAAFGIDEHSLTIIRNSLINDPYFQPELVRVGVLDGEIISHAVILHRPAWVGNQVVNVAGITAVATHPYYQRRGFGTRVMRDTLAVARRRAYDLAIITTQVPSFFRQLGFVEAPAVLGYECPATALARIDVPGRFRLQRLDYPEHWPILDTIYREYSHSRTGMQVRESRFWESWPRRGTFPQGFSNELDSIGVIARWNQEPVAYLAAQHLPDQTYLTFTEFAHRNDVPEGLLFLLRHVADSYVSIGGHRTVLHTGGHAPVLGLLMAQNVPVELEVGQGLMACILNNNWLKPCGFRTPQDAIQNLFFPSVPVLWHRDGY